ncbi:Uncharacterised protein r2_g3697 [Pycnogonum litorale]
MSEHALIRAFQEVKYDFAVTLLYSRRSSLHFRSKLLKLSTSFGIKISISFCSFKFGHYFSLKSKVPKYLRSKVVYKFACPGDQDTFYIGKTITAFTCLRFSMKCALQAPYIRILSNFGDMWTANSNLTKYGKCRWSSRQMRIRTRNCG